MSEHCGKAFQGLRSVSYHIVLYNVQANSQKQHIQYRALISKKILRKILSLA